jgi:hypothetical protein
LNHERLIAELSRALTQRGLCVRSEPLWGVHAGGLCRVKGKSVVMLNTKAPAVERLVVLADCLAGHDLASLELSAEARGLLQRRLARRSEVMAPLASSAPGLAKATPGGRGRNQGHS